MKVAILDFETTGLSAAGGDRPIEVAATRLENGRVIDRFHTLMNPGRALSPVIVNLTGIRDVDLKGAPSPATAIRRLHSWLGETPVVAHNAHFDYSFYESELRRNSLEPVAPFVCSLKMARRIFPESPNHELTTLIRHLGLYVDPNAHRASADVDMTRQLWELLVEKVSELTGQEYVSFELMKRIQTLKISSTFDYLRGRINSGVREEHRKSEVTSNTTSKKTSPIARVVTYAPEKFKTATRMDWKRYRLNLGDTKAPPRKKFPIEEASAALSAARSRERQRRAQEGNQRQSDGVAKSLGEHQTNQREFVSAFCITCDELVTAIRRSGHPWLRCTMCGFNTPPERGATNPRRR